MRILVGLLAVTLALPLTANELETIQARQQGTQLVWSVPADHPGASLNLVTPDGQVQSIDFAAAAPVELDLSEMARTEGQYIYELTIKPQVDAAQREALQAARERGETLDLGLNGMRLTGAFRTINDNWFGADSESTGVMEAGDFAGDENPPGGTISDVIVGDLSVQGSICVGMDCAAAESFGSDTLRFKENNLRIHFDDTSNSSSFPGGDWRVAINSTANGGADYFAVEWATGGTTPFRVEGGAPNNALWVNSIGDVGVGTPTPAVELHVRDGDSPALRLEQDNSAGFNPQIWDLAGNETNFFLRNVSNSSDLPFRVFPDAGDDLLVMRNGRVGINTDNPAASLHIAGGDLRVDGTVYQLSSRAAKTDLTAMDAGRLLELLSSLDLFNWRYQSASSQGLHFGPTAEDFYALFGLGESDRHISVADMAGVALGAAQALQQELVAKDQELEQMNARLERLERMLDATESE